MDKTVVALLGLALLVSPAIPGLAQQDQAPQDEDRPDPGCAEGFHGAHWILGIDPELPGAVNLTLAESNATLAEEIRLPGDGLDCELREDRVELSNDAAEVRLDDRADLRAHLETEDGGPIAIALADDVTVEQTSEGYLLTPGDGPTLHLSGEGLSLEQRTVVVAEEALLRAQQADVDRSDEPARGPSSGDETPAADRGRGEDRRGSNAERAEDRRGGPEQRPQVSEGDYHVGAAELRLVNDTLRDVQWRNVTLFRSVEAPGLTPAEERQRGPQLRLEGEDARVRIQAAGGLRAEIESDAGLRAEIGSDVDVREDGDHVFLSTDDQLVVVEGEDLEIQGRTLAAEEVRMHARSPQPHDGPVWREGGPTMLGFPHSYDGRHVSFALTEDRLGNISVHGTPVGEIRYDPVRVDHLGQHGVNFEADGEDEDFELRVQDTPAVQLRLEATNLSTDLPERTTLPSGAQVHVDVEDDELRLRVDRPADALGNRTIADHRAPSGPVEETEGPAPGLQTSTERGQLGVESTNPNTITTSFASEIEDLDGNVSVQLGLARAMLIDDTNGNSRVDVGEPALAERPLTNGSVAIQNETLVHRFPLWSGNLTVTVEPGEETAKVTYEARNLAAPPGTLFVLETNVQAPSDANLTPTDTGVIVDNGSMQAEYSATGPVTVDGEEAWAQRSIFVDGDDRVRVLLAYPAGDDIEHDPTVAVQSTASEVAERLAASPYAVLAGAGLAGLLVAGTVLHRRRRRP